MNILESITKTLGLDSLGKSLGLDWFKNAVPSFKKALEVATQNKDGSFLDKIGIFWTTFNEEKDKLDGEKKEIAKTTDEKVKATLDGVKATEGTKAPEESSSFLNAKINIPDGSSVVDDIKMKLKENKKEMVRLIESMFTERLKKFDKDLTDEQIRKIVIAAIANAYGESMFNPNIGGDGGASVGLFQLNKAGLGAGMYKAWKKELKTNPDAPDPRKDPVKNISKILDNVTGGLGKKLIARAKAGAEIPELIKIFVYDIENPARPGLDTQKRIGFAKKLFGEDLSNAPKAIAATVPSSAPTAPSQAPAPVETAGKNISFKIDLGTNKQGFCDINSGQKTWFLGSSSVAGMPKSMGGRLGVVAIGAGEFLQNLKNTWWNKIETAGIKPPKEVVLTGLGQNSVFNDHSVRQALADYENIRNFLSSKGVGVVKFITVNPGRPKNINVGVARANFNDQLKRKYGSDCIDATSELAEENGSKIKMEYASNDGIHLNSAGKKIWRKIIMTNLNEKQRTA